MIEISRVNAYEGMDENDMTVMDDELYMCASSSERGDREQTQQFFLLDETTIILEIYWDGVRVHSVSFTNNAELTERGRERLTEKGDGEMNKNVEIISGLDKAELNKKVFELDMILGGIELSNVKIQNINTELGRIGTSVENTDHTDLTKLGLTMMDISHMICMLSDFMSYVSKDLNAEVEKLSNLQSELSEAIKKA